MPISVVYHSGWVPAPQTRIHSQSALNQIINNRKLGVSSRVSIVPVLESSVHWGSDYPDEQMRGNHLHLDVTGSPSTPPTPPTSTSAVMSSPPIAKIIITEPRGGRGGEPFSDLVLGVGIQTTAISEITIWHHNGIECIKVTHSPVGGGRNPHFIDQHPS